MRPPQGWPPPPELESPDASSGLERPRALRARFQVYSGTELTFWRLLGGNNRAYGRSTHAMTSVAQARESCLLATTAAAQGAFELTSSGGRAWTWLLLLDGEPVARSDVPYGRRIECRASVDRFREVAPVATVSVVRYTPYDTKAAPRVSPAIVARSPRTVHAVHWPLGR